MSAFFERDRSEINVEDVAKALTLALDITQRELIPPHVRLECAANFGAWLEWLFHDELTCSRFLREFDARMLSGVSASTRDRVERIGLVPSEVYQSDILQVTVRFWSVVTASLVEKASRSNPSAALMGIFLREATKIAASRESFDAVVEELRRLAMRWRAAAWMDDVFPIQELVVLGGNGNVPEWILSDLPQREDR